ncbi:MAG: hypothetical protein BAJALOKI2v1_690013 [Promethearchaeota archaeon]|nr:MAG: hypothetical protein BAJALOKI2v1_690013 [Candidatus Lokiarchaeota archaeon]
MKILYGINTIGQGHINRSRTIINQLKRDGNSVDCLFSGPKPPRYAFSIGDRWFRVSGYLMEVNGLGADPAKTFYENFRKTRSIIRSIYRTMRLVWNEKYDVLFSDFEITTSLAGFFLKKPVVVVDHQHSLIHPGAIRAPGNFSDIFNVICALGLTSPYFTLIICLDFVDKSVRRFKEYLLPLINKPELSNYKTSVENHFCVYLPHIHKETLHNIFSEFEAEKFYVYGFDINEKKGNVWFKPTSRKNFLEDMASSKGIISNSGFSITWEVLIFKKPFYTIPIEHHYEQYVNAYRLSNLKLAFVSSKLNTSMLREFIDKVNSHFFKGPKSIKILSPQVLTNLVYEKLKGKM